MTIPITDLVTLAKMSPRATAGLQAAGVETAEQAAAMTDEQLLAIPYFKGESLGRLRQWQARETLAKIPNALRSQLAGAVPWLDEPRQRSARPSASRPAIPRWADEALLARDLLVEMVKSSNNPGAQLADMAWQAAERFYDRLEARKEKLHGERGAGDAGGAGAAAGRPEEPVG